MNPKPLFRLLIVTLTFLLFAVMVMPLLIHSMHHSLGKWAYGFLSALCVLLALLLRRALTELE